MTQLFAIWTPFGCRERPFDFIWGGGEEDFSKKNSRTRFPEKNIQDRKSSTIRFVLIAYKKTGSRRRRKQISRPENNYLSPIKSNGRFLIRLLINSKLQFAFSGFNQLIVS